MSAAVPRLRMFAGPNGSGKSTLKRQLPPYLFEAYLNADDMEAAFRGTGQLDLRAFALGISEAELRLCLGRSSFAGKGLLTEAAAALRYTDGVAELPTGLVDSYVTAALADLLRQHLLQKRASFACETVMSHPSKVALLQQAQALGYRTYLYFVATEDPAINLNRVERRVQAGGHAVPTDKIINRYHATLDLLAAAISHTNRAFIFDNSEHNQAAIWLAEVTDALEMEYKHPTLPAWFKRAVSAKFSAED